MERKMKKKEQPNSKGQAFPHLNFEHFTPTQFEEFSYELLQELGFVNLNWRKGTATNASPADRGRDIECQFKARSVIDGQEHLETWYVDCKHYKVGVPPDALQTTLSWADAENPDVVLFVCSGYLSNGSKDNLKQQQAFKRYRIKYWENKDLEKLVLNGGRTRLANKYGLLKSANAHLLHPAHLYFATQPRLYSEKEFFKILRRIPRDLRIGVVRMAFMSHFGFETRPPRFRTESLSDITVTEMTVESLQEQFDEYPYDKRSLLHSILMQCLMWKFHGADYSNHDFIEANIKGTIESLRSSRPESRLSKDELDQMATSMEKHLQNLPQSYEDGYRDYVDFCVTVLTPLIDSPDDLKLEPLPDSYMSALEDER